MCFAVRPLRPILGQTVFGAGDAAVGGVAAHGVCIWGVRVVCTHRAVGLQKIAFKHDIHQTRDRRNTIHV